MGIGEMGVGEMGVGETGTPHVVYSIHLPREDVL